MNTRVLMSAAVAAVCLTGFAVEDQVAATNTFGVLKIASSSKRLIIGIPWCGCSTNESDVSVIPTNLVLTAGLSAGDSLHYIQSDWVNFDSWHIEGSGDAVKWVAGRTVSDEGVEPNTTTDVPRGHSMMLMRPNLSSSGAVYLSGQLAKASAGSATSTIAAGTADSPAYTLVASPKLDKWNPNTDATFTEAVSGDQLIGLNGNAQFVLTWVANDADFNTLKPEKASGSFTSAGWYHIVSSINLETFDFSSEFKFYLPKMDAGIGFWYVARSAGSRSVTWKND